MNRPASAPLKLVLCAVLAAGPFAAPAADAAPAPAPAGRERPRRVNPGGIADQPNVVRGDEITEGQRAAVARGLQWLQEHQAPNGGFGGTPYGGNSGEQHAGITALAGLAFMQ